MFGSPICASTPSPCISQLPFLVGTASLTLSSLCKSNRTSVALCGPSGDEVTPGARVRSLLNRPPLDRELTLEGPGFDGLAERQLL